MKPILLCIFLFIFCLADVAAQKRKLFKINPGEMIADKIPDNEKYSYPDFVSGKVYLVNNTYSIAPMNYNSLFGEMQFINTRGDTLSLADEKKIMLIIINNDSFYYKDGYLQLIFDDGNVKLARKTLITFVNRQRLGGFGEATDAAVQTYGVLSNQSYLKGLVAKEIITMAKDTVLYINDGLAGFKEVTKKTLYEIYPKNEKDLKNYLKENKV